MGFASGFAAGLAVGKKKCGGSGGGEDWQPPDWWLDVPEPNDYEIYLLVDILTVGVPYHKYEKILVNVCRPKDANTGNGALSVDWGDGTSETYAGTDWEEPIDWKEVWGSISHSYSDTGQYLIKITTTEQSCFLSYITEELSLLIAKLGDKIIVNNDEASGQNFYTQNAFRGKKRLHWVQFNGTGGLPNKNAFAVCHALRKVDIKIPPKIIPVASFQECRCLKKFDFSEAEIVERHAFQNSGFKKLEFPKCTSIGDYGAVNCYSLEEMYAPLCSSVGDEGVSQCYKLSKAQFAEDCVYGTDCFANCYSLYPRPDGSIN